MSTKKAKKKATAKVRMRTVIRTYFQFVDSRGKVVSEDILGEYVEKPRRLPKIKRFTKVGQKPLYPGDKFFDLLPEAVNFKVNWGGAGSKKK